VSDKAGELFIHTTVASVTEKHFGWRFLLLANLAVLVKRLAHIIAMSEMTHISMLILDHRWRS
jgi:hypothetical protein